MRANQAGSGAAAPNRLLKFRYDLQAQLAEGPVLDTWRAHDRLRNEPVIIKILRERWATDEKAARRWMLQLRKQRGFTMRSSAVMIETGRDGESYYLAREYVDGPSLERWMSQPRDVDEVLGIAVQILQTMAIWHDSGMCHGQLHPGNIILHADGPVFCDWDVTATTLNCLGVLATRRKHRVYLAPEVREAYNATPRSDVYSLGVALWELLTGRRLASELDDRPAASQVNPALPPELDVVVEGMLRPDPDDRYPAAQAAETLARLRSRAEPQVEPSPRERRRQRVRDRRELPRKPLPWPVVVTLVFYRFLFVLLFTLLVCGGTLLGMGYAGYRYLVDSIPPEVIVPDVTGKPVDTARTLFEDDLHLGFTVTLRQAHPSVPAGNVVSTRPEAGRRVREGRTIEAVISTGAELVTVPRLVEVPLEEAQTTLERLGLKTGLAQKSADPRVPPGAIISQSPGPGRKVAPGTPVNFKVSTGPEADEGEAESSTEAASSVTTVPPQARAKRVGRVKITVPSEPRLTWVKIVVRDDAGERTVYNELRYAGDVVLKNVEGQGETVVEVYLNGTRVETKVL